jgi:serine/threonine protein kinase
MAASPSPSSGTAADAEDGDRVAIGALLDGRYRIDALIGSGGMGRVYRGEHTGIGRAVAIKVLHHDLHRNREAAQRFQREAIASGRLDHPNIVNIYDFGVLPDGACYLVMELLEGETLGERLEREGRIPWREALEILRGVLLGLRHAHDRGVVHRDIKPDNVYLARKDGDLIIKILDFGIAKLRAGSADDPASTRAGLTVGTPAYLSPEQAVGGEITPASDLYSASIVLYEMIAGRGPFEDKDPLAMLGAHVSRPAPPLAEAAPGVEVPPGLEAVLQAGLVKAAAERIRTAQEYIALLDRVLASMRRFRTAPVVPAAAPEPAGPAVAGTVEPLPGDPPIASPSAAPDQSVVISIEAAPTLPGAEPQPAAAGAGPPAAPGHELPPQARAVSLTELSETIPRRWIAIGGAVIVLLIVLAVILAMTSSGDYKPAAPAGAESSSPDLAAERELRLKALIHDLQNGKTCAERRAAIAPLVELGDRRAIEPLRAARHRMQGGIAGVGADNTNACLVRDAEAAIKALGALRPASPSTPSG